MTFELHTLRFSVPLVGALFLATACSSSGDPAVAPDLDGRAADSIILPWAFLLSPSVAEADDIAAQSALAAANTPYQGGDAEDARVSQSSAATAATGDTSTDAAGVERSGDGTGTFTYTVSSDVGPGFEVSTDTSQVNANIESSTLTVNRGTPTGGEEAISFRATRNSAAEGTHDLYVYLKTDTPNSVGDADDYLAYGYWILDPQGDDPVGATTARLPELGVFVDSNARFTGIDTLTGTATYAGEAHGLYHQLVAGTAGFATFEADAALTADFGAATPAISGTLDEFVFTGLDNPYSSPATVDNQYDDSLTDTSTPATINPDDFPNLAIAFGGASPDITVALGSATIANDAFQGTVSQSLTLADSTAQTFAGSWGGKFYGDATSDGHPEATAGTFGFANTDGNDIRSFIGIFYANSQ